MVCQRRDRLRIFLFSTRAYSGTQTRARISPSFELTAELSRDLSCYDTLCQLATV
jgi:hypothetical protein